jgi:hypothetical protein
VTLPGPAFGPWALGLALFAAASAVAGGALRTWAIRYVPSWGRLGPIERLLLDIYLGGAVLYAIAILPLGLFTAATLPVVVAFAVAYLLFRAARRGRTRTAEAVVRAVEPYLALGPAVALVSAIGLGLLELSVAVGVPTGNTYDASQLATYTSLLIQNHSVPTSLAGVGLAVPIAYPQGATVWMASAQLLFGLPAARTAVLVTPLFLGLAPLGGYVLADRWIGGPRAGAVLAVVLAVLATWTRLEVAGSYDFVAAFPLVLLLVALSKDWVLGPLLGWPEVVAFGLLAGYAAALNPVGVAWWLLALPVAAGWTVAQPWGGDGRRWFARYAAALGSAAVPIVPSLVAVLRGLGHIGFAPGEPGVGTIAPVGISGPQVIGYVDPFLFRTTDVWLSPFPPIRLELAALLVVGALILLLRPRFAGDRSLLSRFAIAGGASTAAWFLLEWLAASGVRPLAALAPLSNGGELSEMLFTVFVVVATVPLIVLLDRPLTPSYRPPRLAIRSPGPSRLPMATAAVVVGLLLFVPGTAVTASELPSTLQTIYTTFGNVSADDFALLSWAPANLPPGSWVLVAPGSSAEFLPAYAPSLRVLYPMLVGFSYPNATYRDAVREFTNGTAQPNGAADLRVLDADYVAVTGTNTVLGDSFSPAPFLADPTMFPVVFHSGDAYVFAVADAETSSGGLR